MTELLAKVFSEVSKLPAQEQDALASWILAEIQSERHWEEKFARSADVLGKLADLALKEHLDGKTKPLDPDKI